MMTPETILARRRAGIALTGGILAFWLSVPPIGGTALLLPIAGLAGFVLAVRWAVDPDHPKRRKVASLIVVLGVMAQLQNFFHRLALGPDSTSADYTRYFLAENATPAILLLGLAILPRLGRRRTETWLLWVAFALAAVLALVGTANGSLMATRGDPTPQSYAGLVIALRSIALAPALAAAVMLLVPAREVMTEDQAWKHVEALQAQTAESLREAAESLESITPRSPEPAASRAPATAQAAHSPTPTPAGEDLLSLLELRLIRGEIDQSVYLSLRDKYRR
jgi:hypothetical protein